MCGLGGILGMGSRSGALLRQMARSLAHRGPDDEGLWSDLDAGIGFAFRRLAILELSPMGHQPMHSADGRFTIVVNGEIYNHRQLRAELDQQRKIAWRGHSDIETLVEAVAQWGLRGALQRAVGMFAIALWDHRQRTLHLARDRFGEKPLYYGWVGRDFVFASELKAIRTHPDFDNPVDRRALRLLAARSYIPAPFSIYQRIFKLEPASILTVSPEATAHSTLDPPTEGSASPGVKLEKYWSYRSVIVDGLANPITSEAEALEQLEAVMAEAIADQAVADVPVGAFLSGGIDSSTIVALYQAHSPGKVKTFSIGFEEQGFNEAVFAKRVAAHFGTDHHERYLNFREAQAIIPSLPAMYDEPFADSSQIPTHLVSRLAREKVTVTLSGDGGDELFGGYNRYLSAARLWDAFQRIPRPARPVLGGLLARVPPSGWNALIASLRAGERSGHYGTRLRDVFSTARDAASLDDFMSRFLDSWSDHGDPVLPRGPFPDQGKFDLDLSQGAPSAVRMMYNDAVSYLPDDILCKVDRATMAVSLEARAPFLDHRVAELAARIPSSMKIRGGTGKTILRRLLYRHAPPELFERPKSGFAMPVAEWIRGAMRPWAEELLDPKVIKEQGYFDHKLVQQRWNSHLAGQCDSTQALWSILMFQAWIKESEGSLASKRIELVG